VGDPVDVVVLDVDKDKQEISLGMKQTEVNPWTTVAQKYPPGTVIEGTVRNLTNYGAFIEIEEGIDGLLHVSDMSWTRKISHPNEVVEKGMQLKCRVLSVDQDRRRIALGMKQLDEDPWANDIPGKYQPGQIVRGPVTKITNFGVFVGLEDGLEGLLHISELADHKIEKPQDVVQPDQEVEVKILKVDTEARKIGLSLRRVQWAAEDHAEAGSQPEPIHKGPYEDTFNISIGADEAQAPAAEPAAEEAPKDEAPEEPKTEE
jgi:small subunit ribosomal protein S1